MYERRNLKHQQTFSSKNYLTQPRKGVVILIIHLIYLSKLKVMIAVKLNKMQFIVNKNTFFLIIDQLINPFLNFLIKNLNATFWLAFPQQIQKNKSRRIRRN